MQFRSSALTLRSENWNSRVKRLSLGSADPRNDLSLAFHTGTEVKYPYVSSGIFEGKGPVCNAIELAPFLGHATTFALMRDSLLGKRPCLRGQGLELFEPTFRILYAL
jgi:hypothetical protein